MGGDSETKPASLFDFTSQVALRQSLFSMENFVFKKEWREALKGYPAEVRAEVYEAIMAYAFEGDTIEMSELAKMAFNFIKLSIDAMQASYQRKCERNRESANRRWGKGEDANGCERIQADANGCEAMQSNQFNSNQFNSNQVCESDNNAPTHTHEEFEKFIDFCRAKAPLSLAFEEPLSVEVFEWLVAKYGLYKVQCCASDLHNKEAYKNNRNANNTFKRWIKNIS